MYFIIRNVKKLNLNGRECMYVTILRSMSRKEQDRGSVEEEELAVGLLNRNSVFKEC